MKLMLIDAPSDYQDLLGTSVKSQLVRAKELPDLIHLFVKNNEEFENEMNTLIPVYKKNTAVIIWVSWYKKSAKIATDLTEDMIRNFALRNGLVDIKVCAVSDIWSGLKLVVPLKNR